MVETRTKYKAYVQQLLQLAGYADPAGAANRIMELETKIAQAEAQAAADVRSAAAEAAVAAAEKILNVEAKGKLAGELLAKGIEDVRKKLN